MTPQDEQPEAPTSPSRSTVASFINCAQVLHVHELWLIIAFIHLFSCQASFCCLDEHCAHNFCDWSRMCEMVWRFWFVCHFSVAGLSDGISACWEKCPAVGQSGYEHSRLQEIHFPDHCQCLMRRRSLQLMSRLRRFRSFPGFSAVCCSRNIIQSFWNFHDCFRTESRFVLSSHQQLLRPLQREAVQSAMTVRSRQISSRACRSANCVSKAVIDYLVQQKVPETLVSEIVRPSPEAAELLSVLWQLRLPEYVLTLLETW